MYPHYCRDRALCRSRVLPIPYLADPVPCADPVGSCLAPILLGTIVPWPSLHFA